MMVSERALLVRSSLQLNPGKIRRLRAQVCAPSYQNGSVLERVGWCAGVVFLSHAKPVNARVVSRTGP
jgi:hypothetical protein